MLLMNFVFGVFTGILSALLALLIFNRKGIPYWTRYFLSLIHLKIHKRRAEKRLSVYKNLSKENASAVDLGILPSPIEYELENPREESSFLQCDGIHFFGVDSGQNILDLCVNKIGENMASVWLMLKLSEDGWYQLPISQDARKAYIDGNRVFSSSGLQIRCLIPLRKWRVSFNGLLRKCDRVDEGDERNVELVHVKFSFIWLSMSIVQELNIDFNSVEVAKAFANAGRILSSEDMSCFGNYQNRYEQWGQLMGTVKVKGKDEKELYLWSLRTRILDKPLWNTESSFVKLYMYFKDGVPLKIECMSIKDLISNYADGYTIVGGGKAHHLSEVDFETEHINHKAYELPQRIPFRLRGQNKILSIEYMKEKAQFLIGTDAQSMLRIQFFKVHWDDMVGFGVLHHSFRSEIPSESFSLPPMLLSDKKCSNSRTNLVLPLNSEVCESSQVSGGKGGSLSLLAKLSRKTKQFAVPKGLVITTSAFEHHIKSNKSIQLAIYQLKDISCEKIQGNLKDECAKCVAEFASSKLCDVLVSEIKSALYTEFESFETMRFSVRSSACGEDSEDLSAAGQMLTILGIRGLKGIIQAIIQCWSSKFSFEAVQYSRQNGQSIQSSMALVIQEMVPAELSGVMFTVDPVTGDPSYPYITANYGLGETVVSSLAEPDTIILKRNARNTVSVEDRKIGSKETQVFMSEKEGVEKRQFHERASSSCLTDDWAVKIGQVGLMIEDCFCSPRDIEFAVSGEKLFLLQARPITTLHTETEFELTHDQDNPVCSDYEYWTRANTGEVFAGATSPLGISLVVGAMDIYGQRRRVLQEKYLDEVYRPYYLHVLPATHKQITISLIDTLFRMNQEEFTELQLAFEVALFGRVIADKKIHAAGVKKYGLETGILKSFRIVFFVYVLLKAPKLINVVADKIKQYKLPIETYTTAAKTWNGIMSQLPLYGEVCGVHGLASFSTSFFNVMIIRILAKNKKEWDNELYCDFAHLLSSCTDVESADVPSSLQKLAQAIAREDAQAFASLDPASAHLSLKNNKGPAGKLYEDFLEKHGHRCLKEFDVSSISWGMKPEILIPTLQSMVKSPNILNSKSKADSSIESAINKMKTPLTNWNKRLLKFILPWSRSGVGQREKTKSMMIKSVDWFRQSCHHLGRMMVQEGMLPDSDLVFYLTLEEIKEVLETQRPGLVPKAIRRKRLQPKLEVLQFPEIIVGIPRPIKEDNVPEEFSSSLVLTGTPVCQGVIKGKARVITSLEDAPSIQNGDILITHSTDIGWSPYFPLLSGVITVLGGLISHGAVVAREFGLPCIVGVKGATSVFKTGDTVLLDGTKGTVAKIQEGNECKSDGDTKKKSVNLFS